MVLLENGDDADAAAAEEEEPADAVAAPTRDRSFIAVIVFREERGDRPVKANDDTVDTIPEPAPRS